MSFVAPQSPPLLRVEKISHAYTDRPEVTPALAPVTFHVAEGEFVCIVGTSGSGKSTLLRIIGGLLQPTTGEVWLDGALSTEPHPDIGFVFQKTNLMPWRTALENVLLPLELHGSIGPAQSSQAITLLELVGLTALRDRYPAQVSGGQKQRIGIARALANRPKVLLSDEATSALDPETTRAILALLKKINSELGLTIVLITHEAEVAERAERVIHVRDGMISEMDRVAA